MLQKYVLVNIRNFIPLMENNTIMGMELVC